MLTRDCELRSRVTSLNIIHATITNVTMITLLYAQVYSYDYVSL